ncbi:hypothetical protein QA601_18395 [Chitinispirillales bacterium ANBcel5]|uniref:hypothetical protein n=1 Tax=Cellulosispirillum alkaliphilum TaxID=3039283 RepID=UPI002A54766D|nr:hypothetical protein [Chitinispirillales bacterium ANBcel5]
MMFFLAFTLGCHTSQFDISTTDRLLAHGVDAVVGSNDYFVDLLMNFWSYYSMQYLQTIDPNTGSYYVIGVALEESFNHSKQQILEFIPAFEGREDRMREFFDREEEPGIPARTFSWDFEELIYTNQPDGENVLNSSIYPARFGRRLLRVPVEN